MVVLLFEKKEGILDVDKVYVYDKISWHKCYKTIEKCFL